MTIRDATQQISISVLDAELLLAYILQTSRTALKAHPERTLTWSQLLRFFWYVHKRKNNVPLAYITGTKEFYGFEFEVNQHTLVPRPETEQMVELAISHIMNNESQNILLIDIGTGSGCIPISVAKTCRSTNIQLGASDISKKTIKIAKRNANTLNADITFQTGNLLAPWIHEIAKEWSQLIITANLPYITEEQWREEPSIKKEPKSALVADESGLALYRELLEQLQHILSPTLSVPITLYFEIDPDQTPRITPLVETYFTHADTCIHADLSGLARIVEIHIDSPIPA